MTDFLFTFDWVGLWGAHARTFLWAVIAFTLPVFALPLFFAPMQWAKRFGWPLPIDTAGYNLALYFGRCVGAFVLIVEALMLRAAWNGTALVFTFQVLLGVAALMVWVHVLGAWQRRQPLSETLEIGMYGGMGLLALLFHPR